jgi:hypothetical protein
MQGLLQSLLRPTIALLLSPLGLVLVSATRLLIVSDDRPVTATAIASSGGYINTLLGTLIPLVPIFIPYLALVFLLFRRFLISAIAFLAAAFVSPAQIHTTKPLASYTRTDVKHAILNWIDIHTLATVALVFLLFWIFISWLRSSWSQYELFSLFWVIGSIIIILPIITPIYPVPRALSFYLATLRQPWLAEEKITLISGQVDYGYTLTTSDDWFQVLTAGSRTIRYIPASEVASQGYCLASEPGVPAKSTTDRYFSPTYC